MMDTAMLLAILNFFVCSAVGWICLCRIALMSERTTTPRVRLTYVLIVVAFTASAFSPVLFGERPGIAQLLVSVAVLTYMLGGVAPWRNGPPEHARHSSRGT